MKKIRIGVVLAVGLLSACSTVSSATRGVTSAVGGLVMTDADEQKMGLQLATEVKQKETVLNNAVVQDYVSKVGNTVLAAIPASKKKFQYQFTVIQSDQINAFALPGGQVFVYTALLKKVKNDSELAGVLGHEIAHVTQGHARQAMTSQYGDELVMSVLLGKNPGALSQMAGQIVSQGYMAANSRDSENEADSVGLGYMKAAGFEPTAMSSMLNMLASLGGKTSAVDAFFADHPDAAGRSKVCAQLIAQRGYGKGTLNPIGGLAKVQALLK